MYCRVKNYNFSGLYGISRSRNEIENYNSIQRCYGSSKMSALEGESNESPSTRGSPSNGNPFGHLKNTFEVKQCENLDLGGAVRAVKWWFCIALCSFFQML